MSQIRAVIVLERVRRLSILPILIIAVVLSPLGHAADNRLTLQHVLDVAESHHPDLEAQSARADEAKAMSQSAPSLPPPTLFVGAMGANGLLNSDARMESSIGFSQTIPFPTKLSSESKVKSFEASAADAEVKAESLKIRAEAKAAFFVLYGARMKLSLLNDKKGVFEEHNRRVHSTTLSDRIMQAHRIWIQTELELVNNELIVAHEEERVAQGKINIAMGNDPFLKVPELEEPPLSKLPSDHGNIASSHPELQSLEFSQNAAQAAVSQAKSLWLPDLSISYRNARRYDGLMPNYSEVTVGVTLPFLFFWEANGQNTAASARARETESKIVKTRNDLQMRLLESRARAESLRDQLLNFEEKILPQAEKRMKIAHGLVPSDMESLNEHRDAMESVIKLKLAALTLRVDYERAVANLESLSADSVSPKERQ